MKRAHQAFGAAATLLLILALAGTSEAGWRHFQFNNSDFYSLAVAPDGTTHYFLFDSPVLKHVEISSAGKVISEEMVPITGEEGIASVAIDPVGDLHLISYARLSGASSIVYGVRDSGGWQFQSIPNSNCGSYLSFALDANSYPLIPCEPNDPISGFPIDGLNLISYDGTNWSSETITTQDLGTTAKYASVAGGSDGLIQVVYADPNDDIIYAVKRAGTWSVTDTGLATSSILGLSLALDSTNQPGIVFDSGTSAAYAHFDGTSWSEQTILANSQPSNLLFGAGDVPTTVEIVENSKKALYAQDINGAWQFQTIGQGPGLGSALVGLDALGIPHLGLEAGTMDVSVAVFAYLAEPALSIALEQIESATVKSKQKITGRLQLMNEGSGGGGKFKVSYYLSDGPTIDGSARSLGTKEVDAPQAETSATSSFSFTSTSVVSGKYLVAQIAPGNPSQPSILIDSTAAALIQ